MSMSMSISTEYPRFVLPASQVAGRQDPQGYGVGAVLLKHISLNHSHNEIDGLLEAVGYIASMLPADKQRELATMLGWTEVEE